MRVEEIPLDKLPSDFLSVPPTPAMVESVVAVGIIEPIILVEHRKGYRIIGGRRRILAARAASLKTIPAKVIPAGAKESEAVMSLILNEQRAGNPVAELEAIERLLDSGMDVDEICAETGMTKKKIALLMRLRNLSPELREGFEQGRIKPSIAANISKLPTQTQRKLVRVLRVEGRIKNSDVSDVKQVKKEEVVSKLPIELFQAPSWKDIAKAKIRDLREFAVKEKAPKTFLQALDRVAKTL